MRTADLFLSPEGRLDRERWLGAVALLIGLVVVASVATWLMEARGTLAPGGGERIRAFLMAAGIAPWMMLDWKRFQDRDMPGAWALLCPGLHAASLVAASPWFASTALARPGFALYLACLQLGVAVWYGYELAWREGTDGPNAYGPDPRATRAGSALPTAD